MPRLLYNIIVFLFIIGIPFFAFCIVNTGVSLKYETNDNGECISNITGQNLCLAINIFTSALILCFVGLISFAIFRKRIVKNNLVKIDVIDQDE